MAKDKAGTRIKREEALPERLLRRVFESMGDVVDRKLGAFGTQEGLTTSKLIERMKRLIDERSRDEGSQGKIAPHHLKLKIEWGSHSEAPPELIEELEHEVLAAAIDHINDHRYRTLAPVNIETEVDIFTTGISVNPTFGEFDEALKKQDEEQRSAAERGQGFRAKENKAPREVPFRVQARFSGENREFRVKFKPGGKRLSVGRSSDNDLCLPDASVSKIHAAITLNSQGTLLLADTGSTNGTFVNGRRISYGEARQVEDGDVVAFGDIETRFWKDHS